MEKTTTTIKNLKKGNFVLIDNIPCKIESLQTSKSGKHGASKCRVEGIGLLDGRRRNIVKPSGTSVDVPIITKKIAQVLAIVGENVQLMDLSDYSMFEIPIPDGMKNELESGKEIQYFEIMGVKTLKKVK